MSSPKPASFSIAEYTKAKEHGKGFVLAHMTIRHPGEGYITISGPFPEQLATKAMKLLIYNGKPND